LLCGSMLLGLLKTVIQQSFDFSSQYRQIFPFSILFNRIWYKVLFGSFDDSSSINGLFVFIFLWSVLEGTFWYLYWNGLALNWILSKPTYSNMFLVSYNYLAGICFSYLNSFLWFHLFNSIIKIVFCRFHLFPFVFT